MSGLGRESSHDKALRLVNIYRLLRAGPATRAQIVEALGDLYGPNAGRAVRRDLEALAGVPFRELACGGGSGHKHAVALRHDRATDVISLQNTEPTLRLGEEERAALELVRRAFPPGAPHAHDVQTLVERVQGAAESARTSPFPVVVSLSPADSAPPARGLLDGIERALRRGQEVSFRYRPLPRSKERSFDTVEPIELAYRNGHYYLTVYEPAPNQFRDVRVDRIEPTSWRLLPHVGVRAPKPSRITVQYRLAPDLASGGVSERLHGQRVEWEADGSAVVTGEVRDLFWAARLILGYGSKAEALAPPGLRATVAEEVTRLEGLYRNTGEVTG
jgi:predicted DNA-binding transcriptional regulator YafY